MISMPYEKKNPVSESMTFQSMHTRVSPELLTFCAGSLDSTYISYLDNLFLLFFKIFIRGPKTTLAEILIDQNSSSTKSCTVNCLIPFLTIYLDVFIEHVFQGNLFFHMN